MIAYPVFLFFILLALSNLYFQVFVAVSARLSQKSNLP